MQIFKNSHPRHQAGFAYVAILIIILMMTALGIAFSLRIGVHTSATAARTEQMQAKYLSEAAANHAMWRLINDWSFPADTDQYYMHSMGAGRYGYKVRRHTDTTFATVATVGAVGDSVVHQSYVLNIPPLPPDAMCDIGLILHYTFDEPSGIQFDDHSSNAEHATFTSSDGDEWGDGMRSGAITFDGVDDKAETLDGSSLILSGDYTMSVWLNPDATQNQWAGIISKTNASGTENHWAMQFDNAPERNLVVYQGTGAGTDWNTGIDLADLAGAWHNVIVTRSGTTQTSYLDGVEIASGTFANGPNPAAGGKLHIGAERTYSDSYLYTGQLDDVRVYARAIGDAEVANLAGSGCDCLEGHWKLDDGTGSTIAVDSSVWGNDGTLQNMDENTDWVTGPLDGALDFGASSEHVRVPYDTRFDFGTGAFTLLFYFYKSAGGSEDVFLMGEADGDEFTVTLQTDATMDVSINGSVVSNGTAFSLNEWHHAAIVRYSDGSIVTYIDAATDGSGTSAYDFANNTGDLYFGTGYNFGTSSYQNPYTGPLDDIRLYCRPLNASEIGAVPATQSDLVLSTDATATLAGLTFGRDDAVEFLSGAATELMDGDTAFSGNENLIAFHITDSGTYLLSTHNNAVIGGLNIGSDQIAEYDPATDTATMYFDGDTLFSGNENVDAVSILPNGNLALSTQNSATLGGLSFNSYDVVEYDMGTNTATLLFDGGTHLAGNSNIDGVHVLDDGNLLLTTAGLGDTIGALAFAIGDVVLFDTASNTATMYFEAATNFTDLATNIDAIAMPVTPVAAKVYWMDDATDALYRADKDGANQETLVSSIVDPASLALDSTSGKIYWLDADTGELHRANLDGTSAEILVTSITSPSLLRLDTANGKMYWYDGGANIIRRANLDGTTVQDVATGFTGVQTLVIDTTNSKIIWGDAGTGTIRRADLDGANAEVLASNQNDPTAMALDELNGYVYWADMNANEIRRFSLSGGLATPGFTTIFASQQSSVRQKQLGTQITIAQDMTVSSITAYVGGKKDRDIRYALYTDSGGEPGALVVESATAQQSTDAYDWFEITVADTPITAGTYWLALAFNHVSQGYTYNDGTGETRYNNTDAAAGGFDGAWGASTSFLNRQISIYASGILTGSSVESIVAGVGDLPDHAMAIDPAGGKIYWADASDNTIKRANLDGTSQVTLHSGVTGPTFIALDVSAGKMYWGDTGTNTVKYSDLDGANVATIATGMSTPSYGGI